MYGTGLSKTSHLTFTRSRLRICHILKVKSKKQIVFINHQFHSLQYTKTSLRAKFLLIIAAFFKIVPQTLKSLTKTTSKAKINFVSTKKKTTK